MNDEPQNVRRLTDWTTEEFQEYIEAFRTSSDRARYALYIVIVATVLIGIANYNLQDGSWPLSRLTTWYKYARQVSTEVGPQQATSLDDEIPAFLFGGDSTQLEIAREEYLRQLVSRAVLTPSPIPGVWIDFNDLGLVGGIALGLLMLVLVISIVREHENLHLALFKVRCLCMVDEHHANGDSRANLLYHGLAMRQVLSSPPTLARWRKGGILRHFGFIFFLPAVVYGWVVSTNWLTRETGALYGVNVGRLIAIQVLLALLILSLSVTAWLYSRSMALRWERAFFRVNPGRHHAPQMTMLEWIKLKKAKKGGRRVRANLIAQLIDTMGAADFRSSEAVKLNIEYAATSATMNHRDRDEMASRVLAEGQKLAKVACRAKRVRFVELTHFTPEINDVEVSNGKARWVVTGTWTYQYGSLPEEETGEQHVA